MNKIFALFLSFMVIGLSVNAQKQNLKDGTISDIRVLRTPHPSLTKEAIRVISASPPWDSGVERGIHINVFFNIPISFTAS